MSQRTGTNDLSVNPEIALDRFGSFAHAFGDGADARDVLSEIEIGVIPKSLANHLN